MSRLSHDTRLARKHAVRPEDYYDFQVGEAVIADGFPGRVVAVLDGPYAQTEAYQVRLDNGMGGGEYDARMLYRAPTREAAAQNEAPTVPELDPFEGVERTTANLWYPELGSILEDRPPIENLKVYASRTAAFVAADTTDDEDEPQPDEDENPVEADGAGQQDQPDTCSNCGSQAFSEFEDTGRGTRARCAQCDATMVKPYDGVQWSPEFPNSPANRPSRAPDSRAIINDLERGPLLAERGRHRRGPVPDLHRPGGPHPPAAKLRVRRHLEGRMQAKASRLRKEGRVRVLGASHEGAVGEVDGDNALYETEFHFMPGSRRVAYWHCGCKWAAWANTKRTPEYQRFQNRPCSHNLALRYSVCSPRACSGRGRRARH